MSQSFLGRIPVPTPRAVVLYLAGFSCLALTAAMNRHAGVSQAASEHGRDLIGAGAILIDVVGIVIFGSMAGILLAQKQRLMGTAVLLITILSAVYSVGSIITFMATEYMSVQSANQAKADAVKARAAADVQAAHERRQAAAELAKRTMEEQAKIAASAGRKDKRAMAKDLSSGGSALVEALTKEQAPAATQPAGPTEIAVRPDLGMEVLASISTLPERTVTVLRMGMFACLLILFKLFAFPLAGYNTSRRTVASFVTVPETVLVPAGTEARTVRAIPEEIVIEASKMLAAPEAKQKAIAPPTSIPAPLPEPLNEPIAEWRELLDQLGHFHPRKGPLRPRLEANQVGYHWLVWLYAYGHTGAYTSQQMTQLHEQFCLAAWRELGDSTGNSAKSHLYQVAQKLDKKAVVRKGGKAAPTMWHISPVGSPKVKKWLQKAGILSQAPQSLTEATKAAAAGPPKEDIKEPADQEATSGEVVPFLENAGSVEPAPAKRRPIQGLAELHRARPDLEAMRHLARMDKTAWRAKGHGLRPQHLHRFSRARAA